MSNLRPRRSTPAAPRSLGGPAKVAAQAADDVLARGEALAAKALRGRKYDDPAAAPVLTGADDALDAEAAVWAALGALERGQLAAARATLEALLGRQREDGLLPASVGRRTTLLDRLRALAGRRPALRPLDQAGYPADREAGCRLNALVTWAAGEYANRAGDPEFGHRWAVTLEAAVAWIEDAPAAPPAGVGAEAAYHLAQMALGHLAIGRGDAVAGARRWAAAAAAKGRIQDAEREAGARAADVLLAVYIGACDRAAASEALGRASGAPAGLAALAAARSGDLAGAQARLEAAAEAATFADGFASAAEAGAFARALAEVRALAEAQAPSAKARPGRRQLQLSEDEARILSAC
jgi:hypothetical protein